MAQRRPAGRKYPHVTTAARPHDCTWCGVVQTIYDRAQAGKEPWGALHLMPRVPDEETALEVKRGFYRSRRKHGWSVQAGYDADDTGGYRPWVRVWTREAAKAEIVRRVKNGEPLSYNVVRRGAE
jgi:hypothetical protein